MTLVADASVGFKWFIAEPGSAEARALLSEGEDLVAPELLLAEVANAVWKVERRGAALPAQATAVLPALRRTVTTWHGLPGLAGLALAMARRLAHPVYDCFYLALAEREGATLATADRGLVALAQGRGMASPRG